jgi:hypothetical protein
MKIKVIATVVYPVYINQYVEVESKDDLQEAVLALADKYLEQGGIDPLITESNTDLLECD